MKCNLRSQFLKKTHNTSFSRYLLISIFLILLSSLAFGIYSQTINKAQKNLAYSTATNPTTPGRQFSFQGRLTDTAGNAISSSATVIFRFYNSPNSAIGTSLYTSGTGNSQVVIPTVEDNGIFSVIIGKTHGAPIPPTIFTENTEVFLEITVNNETMSPRQQIATVAYALNSESLQGLPPSSSGLRDTIMVLDASGHINLGETTPSIVASSDSLRLEGQGLILQASNGSGGDIIINPDAGGILDLSFELNAPATGGFVKASADANMVSGNLYYGKVLTNYSNNYNFLNFQNYNIGTTQLATRFSVGASGDIYTFGSIGVGTTSAIYKINVGGTLNATTIFQNGNPLNIGTTITYTAGSGLTLAASQFKLGSALTENTRLNIGNTESLYIQYTTGNVGIGTTNPNYKFTISSTTEDQIGIYHDNVDAYFRNTEGNFIFQSNPAEVNAQTHLEIRAKGNSSSYLDMGNSSDSTIVLQRVSSSELDWLPTAGTVNLEIWPYISSGNPMAKFYGYDNGRSDVSFGYLKTDAVGKFNIGSDYYSNKDLGLFTSQLERLTILSGGNVGIGTTAPTQKLDINGNLLTSGYITGDSTDSLRLSAGGTAPGSGQNGSIYFLKSDGTTVAGRIDTTYAGDGTETLDQSFTTTSTNQYVTIYGTGAGADWGGQVFTTSATAGNLSKVTLKMCDGTVSGDYSVWVDIYEIDTYTNNPTGSVIASSTTVGTNNIGVGHTTSYCADDIEEDFTFSTPLFLKANTQYSMMVKMSGGGGNDWLRIRKYQSATNNGYLSGYVQITTDGGTTWTNVNPNGGVYEDLYFKTYRTTRYGSLYIGGINTGEADVAENYPSTQSLEAGDLVSLDVNHAGHIIKTTESYDKNIVGIISSNPGLLLGNSDDNSLQYPVALSGRVPLKISLENGPIEIGDPLTASSTKPGFAIKATKAGIIVAKALESSTGRNTIMAFVNVGYHDPDLKLTSTGEINIDYNVFSKEIESANYYLKDSIGNLIDRIKTGFLSATNIVSERIISETSISENLISPKATIRDLTSEKLISTEIVADTATISGTLYADNIISSQISSLREQMQKLIAGSLIQVPVETPRGASLQNNSNLPLSENNDLQLTNNLIIGAKLTVSGDTQLGNAFITGTFTTGEIAIKDNFIETTNTALYIQPSGLGSVHILKDILIIADSGDVTINGNLALNGSLTAQTGSFSHLIVKEIETEKIKISTSSAQIIIADSGFAQLATSSAELTSNATAGTATLPAGKTELIIHTTKLTSSSMVYLTPNGSTQNQVVYVKSKIVSSVETRDRASLPETQSNFTIALDQPLLVDVDINWWIIN